MHVFMFDNQIWQGLGSARAPSLTLIERALWSAIFSIARGGNSLRILTDALQVVEQHLSGVDPTEDIGFFAHSDEPAAGTGVYPQPAMGDGVAAEGSQGGGEMDMDLSDMDQSTPETTFQVLPNVQPGSHGKDVGHLAVPPESSQSVVLDSAAEDVSPEHEENTNHSYVGDELMEGIDRLALRSAKGKDSGELTRVVRHSTRQNTNPPASNSDMASARKRRKSKLTLPLGSAENPINLEAHCNGHAIVQVVDLTEDHVSYVQIIDRFYHPIPRKNVGRTPATITFRGHQYCTQTHQPGKNHLV
jgi:hypothetical protein